MCIAYYKTYKEINFAQWWMAKKLNCHRSTIHRAMKLFESLGWIEILSGLDPLNDSKYASNIYYPLKEFENFILTTDIDDLMYFFKKRDKEDYLFAQKNAWLENGVSVINATPNATQINTNTYIHRYYNNYTYRGCGNVHNSEDRTPKGGEIKQIVKDLPISAEDKVYFSRYNDWIIASAVEKANWISNTYGLKTLGGFLNCECKKIVNNQKRTRI